MRDLDQARTARQNPDTISQSFEMRRLRPGLSSDDKHDDPVADGTENPQLLPTTWTQCDRTLIPLSCPTRPGKYSTMTEQIGDADKFQASRKHSTT
jgi:hypothetical protein